MQRDKAVLLLSGVVLLILAVILISEQGTGLAPGMVIGGTEHNTFVVEQDIARDGMMKLNLPQKPKSILATATIKGPGTATIFLDTGNDIKKVFTASAGKISLKCEETCDGLDLDTIIQLSIRLDRATMTLHSISYTTSQHGRTDG